MATHGDALGVHEEAISHELLDESSVFLESLRVAATTGEVCPTRTMPTAVPHTTMVIPIPPAKDTPALKYPKSEALDGPSVWGFVGFETNASTTYVHSLRTFC